MIRVLLVDDHPIFRLGLAHYLDGSGRIQVVGQADDGLSGLRVAGETTWDVAIVDLSLKAMGGLELIRRLRERFPERPIVVLSQFPAVYEGSVLRAGAAAFVSKSSDPELLVEVVTDVFERGSAPARSVPQATELWPHETLTRREHQVFMCVVAGRSTIETAAELDISASTVSTTSPRSRRSSTRRASRRS